MHEIEAPPQLPALGRDGGGAWSSSSSPSSSPEIAIRLMAIAEQSCRDVVPEIRAAIEQGAPEPIGDSVSVGLALTTERLEFAVERLRPYDAHDRYPRIWRALTAELDRRHAGEAPQRIMVHSEDLSGLPFGINEMLRRG